MDNIISVQGLTKKFKKFTAVNNISFDIRNGEVFGFLGPNGAGKSTTIRILSTLLRPTDGTATVNGFDVIKQPDDVRKYIGLVAEKIILYEHLTAMENLEFFGKLYDLSEDEIHRRADKWVERLHMTEWMDAQVGTFSTGMKQRINIVRALLTEPKILFLDEPTLGLDPQTSNMIREFIRELNTQGVTVLLTTHGMIEAESLCDWIAIIDHGDIVAIDTVDGLKKLVPDKEHPTLEDVFLNVTGKEIRDTASAHAPTTHRHGFMKKNNNRVR
ncbi:MAG: ABC transporter ATP-binding protein [Candidatus Kerfeldbacteria bacterium]